MFLVWCMAPFPWNGSEFLYHRILKPFVAEHKKEIDEYLEKAKERASQLYDEGMNWWKEHCSHLFHLFLYNTIFVHRCRMVSFFY